VGTGNAAPTVGNVVTSSYPSAVSYTLTGENFSGVQHLTLKNTGTPTITATFACQNLQQTAPPHFTWNQ
jgi:hypothetical protein